MRTLDILERLVSFETTTERSNLALIGYVETFLADRGFQVHRIPDEDGEKAGLLCSFGPPGKGVMLAAHSDVANVSEQEWRTPPFELHRVGNKLFGCGTSDAKGFLAAMLRLADCAHAVRLREPLKFCVSYDKKIGCSGIRQMAGEIEPKIGLARACLVGAATSMKVASAHCSSAALNAVCRSTPGQLVSAPPFVNALSLAEQFIDELRALEADLSDDEWDFETYEYPGNLILAGMLCGDAMNVVPDHAQVRFEFSNLSSERRLGLRTLVEKTARAVALRHVPADPETTIEIEQLTICPALEVDEDAEIVRFAKELSDTDHTIRLPFGTEAGVFAGLGIPSVVCGPGAMTSGGTAANEHVLEEDLGACDGMFDRLLEKLSA